MGHLKVSIQGRSRASMLGALAVSVIGSVALATPADAGAATLKVNTSRDVPAGHGGMCSLREAIEATDVPWRRTSCGTVSRRSNAIVLRAGRYTLSIPPVRSDANASGDLNVTGTAPLTIVGEGPGVTVIDAGGVGDRVLSVGSGARLTLVRLTITGGDPPGGSTCAGAEGLDGVAAGSGGGIFNSGALVLDRVTVTGNAAGAGAAAGSAASEGCSGGNGGSGGPGGNGGGIYSQGRLSVTASTISDNRAGAGGAGRTGSPGGKGGSGGGIFSVTGMLSVTNSTLSDNFAGAGGTGGAGSGANGIGGSGGAIAVVGGPSTVRAATVADNGIAPGGAGAAIFVQSATAADDMILQSTIVASSIGPGCAGGIVDGGYDLSYGDGTCPGQQGNPLLGPLEDNGGPTETMALGLSSAAIAAIPWRSRDCSSTDQRGVHRPEGRACDIGAYQFTRPTITIITPSENASYDLGSRVDARFRCSEGGVASAIATCTGSGARGRRISTGRVGTARFVVTAIDRSGNRATRTVHYLVFKYVNPLREVSGLTPRRIDLGVDYAGSGPLLAIGRGRVTMASDTDSGPPSCWAISCWPGGGIVVYRLLDGPLAGKYVYVAEHIAVTVRAGQTVNAGQQIATLYAGYPWSEWGWAAGPGPEALGMTDGHRCPCSDPGGWSTIDGRTMNHLLVALGAPSGYLQANTPSQSMPPGWPNWPP